MSLTTQFKSVPSVRTKSVFSVGYAIYLIVLAALCFETFSGPLRFCLDYLGAYPVIYVPKIIMGLFASYLLVANRNFSSVGALIICLLFVSILISWIRLIDFFQPLFEVWVLVPLIFGTLSAKHIRVSFSRYNSLFLVLFMFAIGGVLMNYFVNFPWTGSDVKFAGQDLEVSRDWTTGEYSRIAGFTRASFNAATELLVYSIFVVSLCKRKSVAALVWFLAGLGVLLTTSKGEILTYFILSLYYLSNYSVNRLNRLAQVVFSRALMFVFIFGVFLDIYIPLTTLFITYGIDDASSPARNILFASFGARLNFTWPNELKLFQDGLGWTFGNGLGAIGASQQFVSPAQWWPGDKLFIYLAVQFGLIGACFMFCLLFVNFRALVLSGNSSLNKRIGVPILLLIVSCGFSENVLEDPVMAFALGLFLMDFRNK